MGGSQGVRAELQANRWGAIGSRPLKQAGDEQPLKQQGGGLSLPNYSACLVVLKRSEKQQPDL